MKESLLPVRTVIYRAEPNESDMQLLRRHQSLQEIAEPTDEQSEELAKLSAERVLVNEYRCTLSTYSIMQKARCDANRDKARAWISDAIGVSFTESTDENHNAEGIERNVLFQMAWAWATILPAITSIEYRQVDMLSDYRTEWAHDSIPDAWLTIDSFTASVQDDLFNELANKSYELNPRLLRGIPQDELSKKFGVVSAI